MLAEMNVRDGNFVYEITQFAGRPDREAIITGLAEDYDPQGEFAIPSEMTYQGKKYAVVGLGLGDFSSHEADSPVVGCYPGITSVRIPASVRFIADHEFSGCPNIEEYIVEDGNPEYRTIDGSLIEHHWEDHWTFFRYPSARKDRTFCVPAETDYIGIWAFAANNHLKVLQIVGEQTLETGWQLGNRCIESIDCSNHTPPYKMDGGALYWGASLKTYCPGNAAGTFTPREGTSLIESGAFCEAPINRIVIPNSVTSIGSHRLYENSDIESIVMPEGVKIVHVGDHMFTNCRNLKTVDLGCNASGHLTVGEMAFAGCESLDHITLSEDTKTIRLYYYAFMNCKSLAEFPATSKMKIAELYGYAFRGCEKMTSFPFISLEDIDTNTGYQFAGSGLTLVNWPSALTTVPHGCFKDCKDLAKVSLKMNTLTLGREAFAGCGLEALSLMGVKYYEYNTFSNCPNLHRIYFPANDRIATASYWNIPFIAPDAQVIVNNPIFDGYDRQMAEYPASLYLSMVGGGVKIGDNWTEVWVLGRAGALYRNLTSAPVHEMFSYDTVAKDAAVIIGNLAPGVKITSVEIEGVEAAYADGRYTAEGVSVSGDKMNVKVNYTVQRNPMTSTYEWVYDESNGIDDLEADETHVEQWYSLSGMPVNPEEMPSGVYIRVRDGKAQKVTHRQR